MKFWVVEHNPDPKNNVVSKKSAIGRRFLRTRIGLQVEIKKEKYVLKSRKKLNQRCDKFWPGYGNAMGFNIRIFLC